MSEIVEHQDEVKHLTAVPPSEQITIYRAIRQIRAMAQGVTRDEGKCIKQVSKILKSNYEIAIECFATLPRGGQTITTPSIRLAEILRHIWGYLVVHSWYIGIVDNGTAVKCGALAFDAVNSNLEITEATRPIVTKDGRLFNDDMIRMTIAACQAIARRNAIFGVIPRSLVANRLRQEVEIFLKKDPSRLRAECDRLLKMVESKGYDRKKIIAHACANPSSPDVNDMLAVAELCNAILEDMIVCEELKSQATNEAPTMPDGKGKFGKKAIAEEKVGQEHRDTPREAT